MCRHDWTVTVNTKHLVQLRTSQGIPLISWDLSKDREKTFAWVAPAEIVLYRLMYPRSKSFRWPIFMGLQQMVLPVATSLSYSLWYKWLFTLGILQHIQPQPTHAHLRKRWQHKQAERTLCLLYSQNILLGLLSTFKDTKASHEQAVATDWETLYFFDSPLRLNDPLWTVRSNRWLRPRGKDFQGHLGHIKSLSLFQPNDNLQCTLNGILIHTLSFRAIRHRN